MSNTSAVVLNDKLISLRVSSHYDKSIQSFVYIFKQASGENLCKLSSLKINFPGGQCRECERAPNRPICGNVTHTGKSEWLNTKNAVGRHFRSSLLRKESRSAVWGFLSGQTVSTSPPPLPATRDLIYIVSIPAGFPPLCTVSLRSRHLPCQTEQRRPFKGKN